MIDSFNPYFHMYNFPLRQNYENPRYADPEVIESELSRLKCDVVKLLDVSSGEVKDFSIDHVHQAFKIAMRDGEYTYGTHLKGALHLWLAERNALKTNAIAFVF